MADRTATSDDSSGERRGKGRKSNTPSRALHKLVKVLGMAYSISGGRVGYLIRSRKSKQPPVVCPIALTGRHNAAGLERWLLDHEFDAVLARLKVTEFGLTLHSLADNKKVLVIDSVGLHNIVRDGHSFLASVCRGKVHYLGKSLRDEVFLVGTALKQEARQGSVESWLAAFQEAVAQNPRLLVLLCVSLSAAMRRALGEAAFTLALVAPTSTAKSTMQLVGATLTGPPTVLTWNATNIGLQEWLGDRPDIPSFVEDIHKADKFEDVTQIIMATGNGAGRIRSRRNNGGGQASTLQTTLIVSSEKSLAAMASHGSVAGMLARCFEVYAGKYGMFDNLCGFATGGEFANELKRLALKNHGAIWQEWLAQLSKNWPRVKKWHSENLPEVRRAIIEAAGSPELDELTGRLADRLAFAAFSGSVATKVGLWSIQRQAIVDAFGLVLREHVVRSPPGRNALADAALEAVRAYVESHRGSFPPLSAANDPNTRSGIAGYLADDRRHGTLFLFIPGVFRGHFGEFGEDIYVTLKSAGYLVTQRGRHNLFQKRIPAGFEGAGGSMLFIAIRDTIRYAPGRE